MKDLQTGATKTNPIRRLVTFGVWGLLAESQAVCLRWHSDEASYTQLDVLSSWLVKTAGYFRPRKRVALRYAQLAVSRCAHAQATPIERALSYVTWGLAKALPLVTRTEWVDIQACVEDALGCEEEVRKGASLQDLRQWTRVLKRCSELFRILKNPEKAEHYRQEALRLAEGEARTESQSAHIRRLA